ncbi:MAG TPA: LCP family protein [Ktedonobacteraceae bacterium]|nr:LCP family protein [Ktedonobacteraceae bacterium]
MPLTSIPPEKLPSDRRGRSRYSSRMRIAIYVFLLLLMLLGGAFAYGYSYFENNLQIPLAKFFHSVSRSNNEPAPNDSAITGRPWNILLLGSDDDNKYSFPALLTQVMMIVHVDPDNNRVSMVSIPRDSWVYVPENGGMHKIDQAFFLGAAQHSSFDDGVRLARLTVEQDYGITIDRYAWVGLSGFANVIDTLGGVDIDVTHPIVDDAYPDDTRANPNDPYAVERLYIAPGPHHLNGLQALEYVRSRHADLVGDIGRTNRQQEVLEAMKKKLTVPNIISHFQQLITDLSGKIYTDLSAQEMLAFANFGRTLPSSAIHRVTLGPGSGNQDYGSFATVYDPTLHANQSVVIPHCEAIQPLFNSIFGIGVCNVTGGF